MIRIVAIIFTLFSVNISAQTFSRIIDPVEGDETTFHNNLALDLQACNDVLVLSGQHSCHSLSEGGNNFFCGSISSFDYEGNLLNGVLLDSFFNANQEGLLVLEDRIFSANFKQGENSISRNLYVQEFNQNLELVNQTAVPSWPNSIPNNDGIKFIDGSFYIYGDIGVENGSKSKGFIQKLDGKLNLLWGKQYEHEKTINGCDVLQETIFGNLVFLNQYSSEFAGNANRGIQVVKLSPDGVKIDSLQLEKESGDILALLGDSEGKFYIYSRNHPTDESILEQSKGRINKYSNNFDTLIWSLKLPFNNFVDKRSYNIYDFIEASDGDIIACGNVFDEGPDGPIATQVNHTFNAFMVRVSKSGKQKWLKIFKAPNDKFFPIKDLGTFYPSVLSKVKELNDGRIVSIGSTMLNNQQTIEVLGTSNPHSQFLLLAVDGETGCIDGEECDEIIILDGQYRPRDNYLQVINSNYYWAIEKFDENGFVKNISYTYSEDSVLQVTNYYYERILHSNQVSSPNEVLGYFREIGGRIYQKFEGKFNEKIIFDIHLQTGESITVERNFGPVDLIAISTDTIKLLDDIPRKRILLQCLSDQNPQDTIVWIEGIGELDNSKICDFTGQRSQIVCVQDSLGNSIYNLNGEGCEGFPIMCSPTSFSVGDKWTYENFINFEPGFFQNFTIVDEVEWMGEQALVVKPGVIDGEDYMVQKEDKVYFWDDTLEDYQLNYDFNNDSVYYVRFFNYVGGGVVDSIAIFIDSIRTVDFNSQAVQVQYCKLGYDNQFFETFEVVRGVGRLDYGPRLPPVNFADVSGFGDIRCFESSDCSLQFVDYPCDTIFNTISTRELLDVSDLNVFPNPVHDKLHLETKMQNLDYQILNLQGQQMMQGVYQNFIDVERLSSGIYFLQMRDKDELYKAVKFVKD